jgi:hypothetical protein
MRWVGHVAGMEEKSNAYTVWWANLTQRDHLKGKGTSGRIILK